MARDATVILHFDQLKPHCSEEVLLWVERVRDACGGPSGNPIAEHYTALGRRKGTRLKT